MVIYAAWLTINYHDDHGSRPWFSCAALLTMAIPWLTIKYHGDHGNHGLISTEQYLMPNHKVSNTLVTYMLTKSNILYLCLHSVTNNSYLSLVY